MAAGPHSAFFLEIASRRVIEFEKIEVIVLSHWHVDHSGGMLAAVERCQHAREQQQQSTPPGKKILVQNIAHDDIFAEKNSKTKSLEWRLIVSPSLPFIVSESYNQWWWICTRIDRMSAACV